MWKAIIIAISPIDPITNNITIRFDVYKDSDIKPSYPNQLVACLPDEVNEVLTQYVTSLKNVKTQIDLIPTIKIGQTILV